jgi:hypothetical protein
MMRGVVRGAAVLVAALGMIAGARAADPAQQSAEELRNTVVNLLEALVQKGIITREQAQAMVADAQAKAEATAKMHQALEASEAGAVRVPYVSETTREQIKKEVEVDLANQVTRDVVTQAREERWGVPGALPAWVNDLQFFGDFRGRAEYDAYAKGNAVNTYYNLNVVNAAGGVGLAGETNAFLNTTTDRVLLFGRLRLGLDARLGNDFTVDFRLASGNSSPTSANQTFGDYNQRWFVGVDRAALLWNPYFSDGQQELDVRFGRFANPFVTYNELVWDVDVNFEGVSGTYALHLYPETQGVSRTAFITLGAFPVQTLGQYVSVYSQFSSKWLYAAQLGGEIPYGDDHRVRLAAAYYDFAHITGVVNPPNGTIENFTAPAYMSKGNTVFDISNSSNLAVNLFALAGTYREVNVNLLWDLASFGENHVMLGGDVVKNLAWNEAQVFQLTGQTVAPRTKGWEVGLDVGVPTLVRAGQWRAFVSYRTVQRDAVVDAFNDSDFHLGGTDARGYIVGFDLALSRAVGMRLKYQTANAIDDPPLGIDVLQLDFTGHF